MFRWMANPRLNKALDSGSKMVQIIAILAAGVWTYKTFFDSTRPSLEERGQLDLSISWVNSMAPNICLLNLQANLQNTGIRSFEVSRIWLRGWAFDPGIKSADGSYLLPDPDHPIRSKNLEDIYLTKPFYSEVLRGRQDPKDDLDSNHLDGHYPPGYTMEDTFKFAVVALPQRDIVLRIDVYDDKGQPAWWQNAISPACGGSDPPSEADNPKHDDSVPKLLGPNTRKPNRGHEN